MFTLFLLPTVKMCDKIYTMKRLLCLLLCIILLACGCDTRDEVWGTYVSEDGGKSVEFAYTKVFYALDTEAAAEAAEDEESEALIEGWFETDGDEIVCSFRLEGEDGKSEKHVYTFEAAEDVLTLTGYTVDGEDKPFEREEYKKCKD